MSCVAEQNAMPQNAARLKEKKAGVGNAMATPAIPAHRANCIITVQIRFVSMMSTNGAQNGFMAHGRYSREVYMATLALSMPMSLNMMTANVTTTALGNPSMR